MRSMTAWRSSGSRSATSARRSWCGSGRARAMIQPDASREAIEIGARVLDREDAAAEVDLRQARVREHRRCASSSGWRKTLEEGERGARRADRRELRRCTRGIGPAADPRTAGQGARGAAHLARAAFHGRRRRPIHWPTSRLPSCARCKQSDRAAPRRRTQRGAAKQIEQLTREIVELDGAPGGRRARRPKPRKPALARAASFEERVHEVIDGIATARGDVAHHVGDQPGETGARRATRWSRSAPPTAPRWRGSSSSRRTHRS